MEQITLDDSQSIDGDMDVDKMYDGLEECPLLREGSEEEGFIFNHGVCVNVPFDESEIKTTIEEINMEDYFQNEEPSQSLEEPEQFTAITYISLLDPSTGDDISSHEPVDVEKPTEDVSHKYSHKQKNIQRKNVVNSAMFKENAEEQDARRTGKDSSIQEKRLSRPKESIIDSDSDDGNQPQQSDDSENAEQKLKLMKEDNLECLSTDNPFKITIRRKSSVERDPQKQKMDSKEEKAPETLTPRPPPRKKELHQSVADVKRKCPLRTPVPIIDAPAMPKTSKKKTSDQRVPDMFSTAKSMQTQTKTIKETVLSPQLRPNLKEERNERLRKIAEEKRLSMEADKKKNDLNEEQQNKPESSGSKLNVKFTQKNRGEFLTNLPAEKVSSPKTLLTPNQQRNPSDSISSRINALQEKNILREIREATIDENGICTDLKFYIEARKFD